MGRLKQAIRCKLVAALSGVLDVEPDATDWNIGKDSEIMIENVSLKERTRDLRPDTDLHSRKMTLSASIAKATLSWKWTFSPQEKEKPIFVKDVLLTIRGFRLGLRYDRGPPVAAQAPKPSEMPTEEKDKTESAATRYIKKELKKIVESTTVKIEDFTFILQLPEEEESKSNSSRTTRTCFVVRSQTLQLIALGRHDQQVSMMEESLNKEDIDEARKLYRVLQTNSLQATVVILHENDERTVHPLIHPFHYGFIFARGSRLEGFGRRQDGLTRDKAHIKLHTKPEQIRAWAKFIRALFPRRPPDTNKSMPNTVDTTESKSDSSTTPKNIDALPMPESATPTSGIQITTETEQQSNSFAALQTRSNRTISMPGKQSSKNIEPLGDAGKRSTESRNNFLSHLPLTHFWTVAGVSVLASIFFFNFLRTLHILIALTLAWRFGAFGILRRLRKPTENSEAATGHAPVNDKQGSKFVFSLSPVSLLLANNYTASSPDLTVTYCTKGHLVDIEVQELQLFDGSLDEPENPFALCRDVKGSVRPRIEFHVRMLEYYDDRRVLKLKVPVHHAQVSYANGTLFVESKVWPVQLAQYAVDTPPTTELKPSGRRRGVMFPFIREKHDSTTDSAKGSSLLAFPIRLELSALTISKADEDKIWYTFRALNLDINPDALAGGTHYLASAEQIGSKLFNLDDVKSRLFIPVSVSDEIRYLQIYADSATVATGYSSVDWSKLTNFALDSKVYKLPYVYIDRIKVALSYEGGILSTGISDVEFDAFTGDENTTSKDVTNFFSQTVLTQTPNIISNSEVLGVNVIDTTLTAVAPAALATTPIGPMGGALVVVAHDGIKRAAQKGKETRHAKPTAPYKPGDVTRGLVVPAIEPIKGAARGDVTKLHSAADAAIAETTEYVEENKDRLGGATVGGLVTIGVSVAATPAVGVPVGIAAGLATQQVIRKADDAWEKKQEQSEDTVNHKLSTVKETEMEGDDGTLRSIAPINAAEASNVIETNKLSDLTKETETSI